MKLLSVIVFIASAALVSYSQPGDHKKFKDDSEVPRISLADAKTAYDDGSAVIVDARSADIYMQEHIKGAINIPFGSKDTEFDKLPKGKKIITYCSWPAEHTSAGLAFQMNQKGISNVFALKGGIQGWKAAGYPMENGNWPDT